jgi:hypothetical protein
MFPLYIKEGRTIPYNAKFAYNKSLIFRIIPLEALKNHILLNQSLIVFHPVHLKKMLP